MKISDLLVSEEIKRAVIDMGFEKFTPIQKQTIPIMMENTDLVGQSQTGTGKTAAFAIPILEKVDPNLKRPQALILCPTRELAVQVTEEFQRIGKYVQGVKCVTLYGGEPIYKQINALKAGAQIIIGTPGRTLDHINNRKTLKTQYINTLVLDEADEMLKMGFREDIELVLESISDDRQTVLFSATMPKAILNIVHKYQNDPTVIKIKSEAITADTVKQEYCEVKQGKKVEALQRFLSYNSSKRCIVFCNKKRIVDNVTDQLMVKELSVEKIHGDLKQERRMEVMKKFNNSQVSVLVATDVAARGIDIKAVDLIVNFDVPEKAEYYVHRIGRSGRAGLEGHAITLVSPSERKLLFQITGYTKKRIEKIMIPTLSQVNDSKIDVFVKEINNNIENEDLSQFDKIMEKFDEKYDLKDICKALIKKCNEVGSADDHEDDINYVGKPNQEKNERRNRRDRDKRERRDRGDRGDRNSSDKSDYHNKKNKNMTRFFLSVGKKDGVSPHHVLGAITNECDIRGNKVGQIEIYDAFTFVNIDKECKEKVLSKLPGKTINGRSVSVEVAKKSQK